MMPLMNGGIVGEDCGGNTQALTVACIRERELDRQDCGCKIAQRVSISQSPLIKPSQPDFDTKPRVG
jgi:hypothetical protein